MSEILQLNHQSQNTYEFMLEVEGLTSTTISAWFVIKANGVELSFPCTQEGKMFKCIIPEIPYISRSTYNACIRIVADSHYFEPVSDLMVNVVGNLNLGERNIKDIKLTPAVAPRFEALPKADAKKPAKADDKKAKPVKEAVEKPVTKVPFAKKEEEVKKPKPIVEEKVDDVSPVDKLVEKVSTEKKKIVPSVVETKKVEEASTSRVETDKEKATRLILEQQRKESAERASKTVRVPYVRREPAKVAPGASIPDSFFKKQTPETLVIEDAEDTSNPIVAARSEREDKIKNILTGVRGTEKPTVTATNFRRKS